MPPPAGPWDPAHPLFDVGLMRVYLTILRRRLPPDVARAGVFYESSLFRVGNQGQKEISGKDAGQSSI